MINSLKYFLFFLLVAVFWTANLAAQGTIWTQYGDAFYDELGRSVDSVGDLNGDGIDEIIAGAPLDDNNGQESGMARIFNGATGVAIVSIDGDDTQDEFGSAVAGLGDINGDGVNDFAIGASDDENNGAQSGTVKVYSGATFTILYQWDGSAAAESLGFSLSFIGDIDGDGNNDVLVGATQKANGASTLPGQVLLYSGATGLPIYATNGLVANDQFGWAIDGGMDVDGDGINDWVAGHYGQDTNGTNAGAVSLHSGATGTQLWIAYGDSARDHLGESVALIGDVDGDGIPDVIAGASEDDNNGTDSGSVRIFSGVSGAVLGTLDGETALDGFGDSVSSHADINGDGRSEFLVGASRFDGLVGKDCGKLYVIDGFSFGVLTSVEGIVADDRLGYSVSGCGDLNADGLPDFIGGGNQRGGAAVGNGNGFIRAYDSAGTPPPPPLRWPNLPSNFLALGVAGYSENFDTHAGVLPNYMAVNELETISRGVDPDAWCNIGQNGIPSTTNSGIYCLEMGGVPSGMSSNHEVSNGLVIGLDATGSTSLVLDYWAINYGEENQADDGIWISNDGTTWESVQTSWSAVSLGSWTQVTDVDLSNTSVNTSAPFYLLFAQSDNFEYGSVDGIGIDDISVHQPGPVGPTLTISPNPPIAGQSATLIVSNNTANDLVFIAYSLAGGGPTNTAFGIADLTPPFFALPALIANVNGDAGLAATPPPFLTGRQMWMQALNHTQIVFSNGINFIFL